MTDLSWFVMLVGISCFVAAAWLGFKRAIGFGWIWQWTVIFLLLAIVVYHGFYLMTLAGHAPIWVADTVKWAPAFLTAGLAGTAIILLTATGREALLLPPDGVYKVITVAFHEGTLYVLALVLAGRGEQIDWDEPMLVPLPGDVAMPGPDLLASPMQLHVSRGRCSLAPALP